MEKQEMITQLEVQGQAILTLARGGEPYLNFK